MKKQYLTFTALLAVLFLAQSCGPKIPPVSERIAKIWIASSVKEDNVEVYKTGGSANIKPGYSTYRIDLSAPPKAVIREVDGGTYTGTYEIVGSNKLTIKGLSPEPTGTGGTLEFTITTLSEDGTALVLTANQAYPKTGNTKNVYSLVTN
jgi:hypothetical protein